ncbi:hypothetical protein BpHYR1_046018 [Brachionus plicatilis]|uniref:Uncharacterized protein n=1 Tax=Brachionus plicatilis TaxID=10195 RepID=A0A3M7QWT0_BRAPC|nr:hypothetical protein BpHYR1_046018 [Brachionus plicatilis]
MLSYLVETQLFINSVFICVGVSYASGRFIEGVPVTCSPVREKVGACLALANQLAFNCKMTSSGVPYWTYEAIRRQPLIAVYKACVVVDVLNLM